jgi:hypothetical protein
MLWITAVKILSSSIICIDKELLDKLRFVTENEFVRVKLHGSCFNSESFRTGNLNTR